MPACDAYILCTSPRSGSTLLCRMLRAAGAGRPGSHFHDPSVAAWLAYFDLAPDTAETPQQTLARIFAAALERGRGGAGVFGLRLQRPSFAFFADQLRVLHPGAHDDGARIAAAFGRTRIIHLTRRDKVAQAVSFEKANQSGLWHVHKDGSELERLSPHRDPVYDEAALVARHRQLTHHDQAWLAWFRSAGFSPLTLTYEDLTTDPGASVNRVLSAIGLPSVSGLAPDTARLADGLSQDWTARLRRIL